MKENSTITMNKFKDLVLDLLEYDEGSPLDMNLPMKDIDEWDSLTLLGFLAMIENEYNIQMDVSDLDTDLSFEKFYNQFIAS